MASTANSDKNAWLDGAFLETSQRAAVEAANVQGASLTRTQSKAWSKVLREQFYEEVRKAAGSWQEKLAAGEVKDELRGTGRNKADHEVKWAAVEATLKATWAKECLKSDKDQVKVIQVLEGWYIGAKSQAHKAMRKPNGSLGKRRRNDRKRGGAEEDAEADNDDESDGDEDDDVDPSVMRRELADMRASHGQYGYPFPPYAGQVYGTQSPFPPYAGQAYGTQSPFPPYAGQVYGTHSPFPPYAGQAYGTQSPFPPYAGQVYGTQSPFPPYAGQAYGIQSPFPPYAGQAYGTRSPFPPYTGQAYGTQLPFPPYAGQAYGTQSQFPQYGGQYPGMPPPFPEHERQQDPIRDKSRNSSIFYRRETNEAGGTVTQSIEGDPESPSAGVEPRRRKRKPSEGMTNGKPKHPKDSDTANGDKQTQAPVVGRGGGAGLNEKNRNDASTPSHQTSPKGTNAGDGALSNPEVDGTEAPSEEFGGGTSSEKPLSATSGISAIPPATEPDAQQSEPVVPGGNSLTSPQTQDSRSKIGDPEKSSQSNLGDGDHDIPQNAGAESSTTHNSAKHTGDPNTVSGVKGRKGGSEKSTNSFNAINSDTSACTFCDNEEEGDAKGKGGDKEGKGGDKEGKDDENGGDGDDDDPEMQDENIATAMLDHASAGSDQMKDSTYPVLCKILRRQDLTRDPTGKVTGFFFKADALPSLAQVTSVMWQIGTEADLLFEDEDHCDQPVGCLVAHDMGIGKTVIILLLWITNAILEKVKSEMEEDDAEGLEADAEGRRHCHSSAPKGTLCPSRDDQGLWQGTMVCPCEPDSPTAAFTKACSRGALLQIVRPHLVIQTVKQFDKFIDRDAFEKGLGYRPVVVLAYEWKAAAWQGTTEPMNLDNAKDWHRYLSSPHVFHDWVLANMEANPNPKGNPVSDEAYNREERRRVERDLAWRAVKQNWDGVFRPEEPRASAINPAGLMIVSTADSVGTRLLQKVRNADLPSAREGFEYLSGLHDMMRTGKKEVGRGMMRCTAVRNPNGMKGMKGGCWSSKCTNVEGTGKTHKTEPGPAPPGRIALAVNLITLDEAHEYSNHSGVRRVLETFITTQRRQSGRGAKVVPTSGTMNVNSPFDMDSYVALQWVPAWDKHPFLKHVDSSAERFCVSAFERYKQAVETETCSPKIYASILSVLSAFLTGGRNGQTSITPLPDLDFPQPADDAARLAVLTALLERNVAPALLQRARGMSIRYDRTTLLNGLPVVQRGEVERAVVECPPSNLPIQLRALYDEAEKNGRQAMATINRLRADRQQRKREGVKLKADSFGEERSSMIKSTATMRKWKSIKVIPLMVRLLSDSPQGQDIHLYGPDGEFVDLFQSQGLAAAKCFRSSRFHPMKGMGHEIYLSSGAIQALCDQIKSAWKPGSEGSRRSAPHERLLAPIAVGTWEVANYFPAKFALEWYFDPANSAAHGTQSIVTPGRTINVSAILPGTSSHDRDTLTKQFCFKEEDISEKSKPLDILFLPSRCAITGLNLVECSLLFNLDIIPKLATQMQLEGRFDRPGQERPVKVVQLVEHKHRSDALTDDMRRLARRAQIAKAIDNALPVNFASGGSTVAASAMGVNTHSPIIVDE